MDFITIPIIVAICGIFMSVLKLFTKNSDREEEFLSTLVPLFGALLALLLYFIHSEYTLEFADPLVAVMIGFVSGQAALETKSTIDYIKSKNELKDLITEEITSSDVIKEVQVEMLEEAKTDIVNEIVQTEEIKQIIKDVVEENNN